MYNFLAFKLIGNMLIKNKILIKKKWVEYMNT